ncbi:S-adenosyl-L-methionine-dependent methyltransferase [Laetiporus sulphureus 93-53]|uniref:S-adenosyl-L-methionine-dependent methyltransferase n=1 Tax=Laetiporus sulphureus 93-53 TaxID=1314785 RepID=A0A165HSP2_9APHY|nr:S-adenosyl-L-methionine-dependent methyltransferase [Laetiporus sulphureus 93-53]KZT12133.1 S-adenosyl-L-methionine-dependent methyltransferase [Laetiporus sulphureus 93-53]
MAPSDPARKTDTWSASTYNDTASFVYSQEYTFPVLQLLDAKPGEKIIDFGCGSGELTLKIQEHVGDAGLAVGFDNSQSMIDKCKANGLQNAFVGDAQDLHVPEELEAYAQGGFDAVFSNAALHWCKRDPRGVLDSARRLLRPGGRFIAEMGGFLNCIGVRTALHQVLRTRGYNPVELDPWYFPSTEGYQSLLESCGFEVKTISLLPRVTRLPGPLMDWLRLFARPYFMAGMSDQEAEEIMLATQDVCSVDCRDSQGRWTMMYMRLRVAATIQA